MMPLLGLEEQNIDAVVELILDADRPRRDGSPRTAAGTACLPARRRQGSPSSGPTRAARLRARPLGFRVYVGTDPSSTTACPSSRWTGRAPDTAASRPSSPAWAAGPVTRSRVRSYNAVAEEQNTTALIVTPDDSPPSVVDALQAVATNQES